MKHHIPFFIAASFIALVACSSEKTENTPGSSGEPAADAGADGLDIPAGGTQCTAARDQLLVPIGKVSTGQVKVVKTEDDVTTLYIDASAGGFQDAAKTPRVYVNLAEGTRVGVTDKAAFDSADWDLAFKRSLLYTNGGDTGIGKGAGAQVPKDFAAVTAEDADGIELKPEKMFDDNCVAARDEINAPVTTFTGWYVYDQSQQRITGPQKNLTFIVRSADGTKRYKVAIVSFNGEPDGTIDEGNGGGFYLLKVAPL